MKKKMMIAAIGAGALLLTAACGSSDTGDDAPAAEPTARSASDAAVVNDHDTPPEAAAGSAWIQKGIGEEAGMNCTADLAHCDVLFTVTDLTPNFECDYSMGADIDEGTMNLAVSLDAEMADEFLNDRSSNGLHVQHWGVMDDEGYYITSVDTVTCSDTTTDTYRLSAGTKARSMVVINVPENSKSFRIGQLSEDGGWEWPIPRS